MLYPDKFPNEIANAANRFDRGILWRLLYEKTDRFDKLTTGGMQTISRWLATLPDEPFLELALQDLARSSSLRAQQCRLFVMAARGRLASSDEKSNQLLRQIVENRNFWLNPIRSPGAEEIANALHIVKLARLDGWSPIVRSILERRNVPFHLHWAAVETFAVIDSSRESTDLLRQLLADPSFYANLAAYKALRQRGDQEAEGSFDRLLGAVQNSERKKELLKEKQRVEAEVGQ